MSKNSNGANNTIVDHKKIDEILDRGMIVEILPSKDEFRNKLLSGEKMRFYIGFDATAPNLHLSHAKNFMFLEKIRKLGHEVIVLFGDFTATIGDPSDKDSIRKRLSREEVAVNVKKWRELIKPLMDFEDKNNPPKIMYNGDWLRKLNLEDLVGLASNFTVQQILERDMFQKRLKENKPIYLHEFLYPLMQGYDSVAMDVDVEVCGTDQIFNALAGRTLLKKLKNKDKYVVALTLMENPKTGEMMSKSRGVGVFLDASPDDMYGQIMAQPDEMLEILFTNNTYLPLDEIKNILEQENPRDVKMRLALEIAKIFYGDDAAQKAERYFIKTVQKKETPDDIEEIKIKAGEYAPLELLALLKLASSKNDAKRLIEQGAVKIDNKTLTDWRKKIIVKDSDIIKVGKRKFVKIAV